MTRQTVAGPLTARHLGAGVWHLTTSAADLGAADSGATALAAGGSSAADLGATGTGADGSGAADLGAVPTGAAGGREVFLLGLGAQAAALLQREPIARLRLEWRRDGVTVTLTGSGGVRQLSATGAIVHEPQPRLYETLPLPVFDAQAQQFWRRVFRLMRIPGGRFLLKFIARRERPKMAKPPPGGPNSS